MLPWLLLSVASLAHALPFISSWRTTVAVEEVVLGILNVANITVDWGDGEIENYTTTDVRHTYEDAGVHTISVSFVNGWRQISECKVVGIHQWGDFIVDADSYDAFYNCDSLVTLNATDQPILSGGTLKGFFRDCGSFNVPINWTIDGVTDLSFMFSGATLYNSDVTLFDTSLVQNFEEMFSRTAMVRSFSHWNVEAVSPTGCVNFCEFCGLPSFAPTCEACGLGVTPKNSSQGLQVCVCPPPETIVQPANTQCVVPTSASPSSSPSMSPNSLSPTHVPSHSPQVSTTLSPSTLPPSTFGPTISPSTLSPSTLGPTHAPTAFVSTLPTTSPTSKGPTPASSRCPRAFSDLFLLCFNEDFNKGFPACSPGCVSSLSALESERASLGPARAESCFNELNIRRHFDNGTALFLISNLGKDACKTVVNDGFLVSVSVAVGFLVFLN